MHTCDAIERYARLKPDATALVEGETTISWGGLASRVASIGGALTALGIEPEDRVALLAENSGTWIEASYAVQWIGAVVVPINMRWTPAEIAFAIEDCGPMAAVVDAPGYRLLSQIPIDNRRGMQIIHTNAEGASDEDLNLAAARRGPSIARRPVPGDATASIFYTGGTTGRSKGVLLTHDNHVAHSVALATETGLAQGSRHLHAAPMFHIADSLFIHLISLVGGVHVVIPRFEPKACAAAIERHQVDQTILVPTMIQMMMATETAQAGLAGLKKLFYGASPMPLKLLQHLMEQFPKLELIQLYGQTESSPVLTVLPPQAHRDGGRRVRSAGCALAGTEVKIFDAGDRELGAGEHGEIVARGPQVTPGYWNRPKETAEALRGGWLHTGDAGFIDEQGYVRHRSDQGHDHFRWRKRVLRRSRAGHLWP